MTRFRLQRSLPVLVLALALAPLPAGAQGEAAPDTSGLSPLQRLLLRAKEKQTTPAPRPQHADVPLPAGVTRLTETPANEGNPCWAPDGSIYYDQQEQSRREIYRLDLDSGESTLVSMPMESARQPSISPDGNFMAFVRNAPGLGPKIFVMRLADGEHAKLTPTAGREQEGNPAWSHQGGTVFFSVHRQGSPANAAMEISREGERMRDLGEAVEEEGDSHASPRPSPDGRRLGWVVRHGQAGFLRLMDRKISSLVEDIHVPDHFLGPFDWLPDGRRVVVSYLVLESPEAGYSLGILDLESGELSPWLDLSSSDGQPAVSPDGKRVVFRSKRGGNADLYLAELP